MLASEEQRIGFFGLAGLARTADYHIMVVVVVVLQVVWALVVVVVGDVGRPLAPPRTRLQREPGGEDERAAAGAASEP